MTRERKPSKSTQLILQSLSDTPDTAKYGYALMSETGLKSGTLYPILMRLKDRGYLTSDWAPSEQLGRPPRQRYTLTPSGRAYADRALLKPQTQTRSPREVRT